MNRWASIVFYGVIQYAWRLWVFTEARWTWAETRGLWGLHLLDVQTLKLFPQISRTYLPSVVWLRQREALESEKQSIRWTGHGDGAVKRAAPGLNAASRLPLPPAIAAFDELYPDLVGCYKCHWRGLRGELLDGEACPRCRLVL